MTLFDRILAERKFGRTRCASSDATSLERAARAFGLLYEADLFREIARAEAHDILVEVLHRDLAYRAEVMPLVRAQELADAWFAEVPATARYFTNWYDDHSWGPATYATFDCGVLAVADCGSTCCWVEDED